MQVKKPGLLGHLNHAPKLVDEGPEGAPDTALLQTVLTAAKGATLPLNCVNWRSALVSILQSDNSYPASLLLSCVA